MIEKRKKKRNRESLKKKLRREFRDYMLLEFNVDKFRADAIADSLLEIVNYQESTFNQSVGEVENV